jgi:hypothetical protein
MVNTRTNCNG